MRCLFLERFLFNSLDNWLYDFERDWYKKSLIKKILVGPLIIMLGDIRNVKRSK